MNKLLIIFLLLTGLSGLSGCQKRPDKKLGNQLGDITAKADPVSVEVTPVGYGHFPVELVSNGRLEARRKVSLSFRKTGRIAMIPVRNGSWVKQGDLLAELENEVERINLEEAVIRLEKARRQRASDLIGQGYLDIDLGSLKPETLRMFNVISGFAEAELAFRNAEIQMEMTRLVAPFDGRIANLEAKAGNLPPADKPFCLVIDDREFDVVFPVMESEMFRLSVGMDISAHPYSLDSMAFPGRIAEINPLIDERGLVKVKALIANSKNVLVEGMNVKVFIRYQVPGCLIVPKEALVLRNNRQVVFSLLNGRSYWNYVETVLENSFGYTINVLTGVLKPGDTIITKGNLNLAHDADIQFQ
ncbi:MAG: efflux RND transporter periplasmic adaptor subunit [Bacteroidales bacterium]